MATFYLDFEGGSDAADGTTFANRWKTVTAGATAARIAPADVIRVMGSPAPTSLAINATWTNKSSTVTLASVLNATITECDAAWTAAANVTATADTTYFRTGTAAASLSIAAGFTTGLAAHFATGVLNLSAYQGITLWVMVRTTTLAAATLSIRLCSDAGGLTTVDTLALPAITLVDCWVPVYIDKGSALGANINSIALYADLDPGTVIVYLDNINTVKAAGADALTHRKLISKNTTDELWWGIRQINGVTITLDGTPYNLFGTNQRVGRGYWGTTATVTTHIREVIRVDQTSGTFAAVQDSGTAGSLISFTGGWDRTNMSTQTLETWVDGSGAYGVFWFTNDKDYIHVDLIHGVRWDYGLYHQGSTGIGCTFGTVKMGHCRSGGIYLRSGGIASAVEMTGYGGAQSVTAFVPDVMTITKLRSISGGLDGGVNMGFDYNQFTRATITTMEIRNAAWHGWNAIGGNYIAQCTIGTLTISDCGQTGFLPGALYYLRIGTLLCTNNGSYGASFFYINGRLIINTFTSTGNAYGAAADTALGAHVTVGSYTSSGNTNTTGITVQTMSGIVEILASSIAEATKVLATGAAIAANPYGRLTLRNYLGTVGDHRSWVGGIGAHGTLLSETTIRNTPSGLAWKLSPTHAFMDALVPLRIPLATVRVNASALVTVKLFMRRTNLGLTGTLFCRGGQLTGVPNDVSVSITAAIDTWQEVTITFTPTEAGVIDLEVLAYGGTTFSLYYDDLSITQA